MKLSRAALVLTLASLGGLAGAAAARDPFPLGYPGVTWGDATRDADNYEGWGTMGYVRQGVDVLKLPGDHFFGPYGELDWRLRSNNTRYYDSWSPGGGAQLRGSFYTIDLNYAHERWTELGVTNDRLALLASAYKGWELLGRDEKAGPFTIDCPGSLWVQLYHSFDDLQGTGSQGRLDQGVRWLRLPGQIDLVTLAEYRWRVRELHRAYYDAHGPAVGVELQRSPARLGVEYFWQYYPGLHEWRDRALFYLAWYYGWDLKRSR